MQISPVFTNQNKSEVFCFYNKKIKTNKKTLHVFFAAAILEAEASQATSLHFHSVFFCEPKLF